jgi:hypothetical protein
LSIGSSNACSDSAQLQVVINGRVWLTGAARIELAGKDSY